MSEINVAEAKSHFSDLLQRASEGEEMLITLPVAKQMKPKLGTMAGSVVLAPGWDAPLTDAEFEEFTNHGEL